MCFSAMWKKRRYSGLPVFGLPDDRSLDYSFLPFFFPNFFSQRVPQPCLRPRRIFLTRPSILSLLFQMEIVSKSRFNLQKVSKITLFYRLRDADGCRFLGMYVSCRILCSSLERLRDVSVICKLPRLSIPRRGLAETSIC